MRLLFLSGLACLPALAQATYSCDEPPPPGEITSLYQQGRALMNKDARRAIGIMQQVLAREPRFPWARLTLGQIYLLPQAKDEPRAIDNLNAYIQLCPANLDAWSDLRRIQDRDFATDGARRLRFLLTNRRDDQAVTYYPILWSTELRIATAHEQESVRGRIAQDLERLKTVASLQREGHKILGEARSPGPSETAAQAVRDWHTEHPRPNPSDRAAQKKYARALLKAADEWVKKYPGEFTPLHERFVALEMADASKSDLKAAGEALMRHEDGRASLPGTSVRLHVARVWLQRQIRVADIPAIVEKGMERRPAPEGFAIIADAYLELDKPFKAREALDRLQDWLEQNKTARTAQYTSTQAQYYTAMARLAEKQGSKLDALTYYERAIAISRTNSSERAHALWKELGGTNEGWLIFSNPPASTSATPGSTAPRVTSRAQVGKPLPPLTLKDFEGKTWTLASFQGKTTLINVWATWCGPCQKELPFLQKLYDRIRSQPDVQVLTLNVDEDIDKVKPYLAKNKYTFPVLLAHAYVRALLPNLSIPRNWIVDKEGLMREETIGFGGSGNQWIDNALEKLKE
jgi:thiol-disulfide isomerase/thioredoxin/tetratricopeptide (TPR) repeat protein